MLDERGSSEVERAAKALKSVTQRIKVLGEAGRSHAAIKELAGLASLGLQPDHMAATACVRACTKDMQLAQAVFEQLFGELRIGTPSPFGPCKCIL